jgi:general secretion pathway protein M
MNDVVNASDTRSAMSDATSELRAKWLALAPRERQLIVAMAWLAGLVLLVLVGIRPAWRSLQQTPDQIKQVDTVLDDMRRQADEVRQLRQLPTIPAAQAEAALYAATQRLGSGAQLRVQADRATVTLVKVSGAGLAAWLEEARTSARARPAEANLIQVVPGAYSGSVTLVLAVASPSSR